MNPITQQIMEQVMGWTVEKVGTDFGRDVFQWYEQKDGVRYNVTHTARFFDPTENIEDAWKVVDKLNPYNIQFKRFDNGKTRCYMDFPYGSVGIGFADTTQMAMLLAVVNYLDKVQSDKTR
jgi:hypothetical protein